jgi:hypothetical protein
MGFRDGRQVLDAANGLGQGLLLGRPGHASAAPLVPRPGALLLRLRPWVDRVTSDSPGKGIKGYSDTETTAQHWRYRPVLILVRPGRAGGIQEKCLPPENR